MYTMLTYLLGLSYGSGLTVPGCTVNIIFSFASDNIVLNNIVLKKKKKKKEEEAAASQAQLELT